MSMAAGEYVSVSSQADSERSDLARERRELEDDPEAEHRELAAIYVGRGLDPNLASEVARQLAAKDALAAHARDELGFTEALRARPIQAALASAAAFAAGAALPLADRAARPARGAMTVSPRSRWCSSRASAPSPRASGARASRKARGGSRSGARSPWRSPRR